MRSLNTSAFGIRTSSWTPATRCGRRNLDLDGASGFRVGVAVSSLQPTIVCLDDLSVEGPIVAQPSPTATDTPTAPATPTNTASTTSTPPPTETVAPASATATSVAATATSAAATATAAVATSTSPSLTFINGGFEETTAGWRTQGGQLDAVTSPKLSGGAAGRYTSATDATKFVYQTVAIDPGQSYEFRGAVMTEGAVAEAFLRVAWYGTSDGSGSQMETIDSPTSVGANSGGFVALTTGLLIPPANARSARLRVVLSPSSAAAAVVYLDDFSLLTSAAATTTPTSTSSTAVATIAAAASATPPSSASSSSAESAEPGRTPPAGGLVSETSSTRATPEPGSASAAAAVQTPRRTSPSSSGERVEPFTPSDDEPLWPYLAAVPIALLLGGGGYYYSKRRKII